ncbi:MAG: hypothetical protein ACLGQW_10930 [Acidobacteriota bacterium]
MMDDYRSTFRVEVDESYVLELAVWLRRSSAMGHLHLSELGDPKMIQGKPPLPRIDDISSNGMCLSFRSENPVPTEKFHGVAVLVYFKLVDPMDVMGEPLSFFSGYEAQFSQHHGARNYLGLKLRWDGVPDQNEKAVSFADATKYGIADLTKWCDDMNRKALGQHHRPPGGLRLERLLRELETIRAARLAKEAKAAQRKA